MKTRLAILVLGFLFADALCAQQSIPAGTILPARLDSSLNSHKVRPGEKIKARIMQNVPLPSGKIPQGAKLIGEVLSVTPGKPAEIRLRFNRLEFHHQSIPVNAHLRAIASLMEVEDAQTPKTGPDRGTPWVWTIRNLIGDQTAYGQGPVAHGVEVVGEAIPDGVLAPPRENRPAGCHGDLDGQGRPQAFWVFSSDACGVYGLDHVKIVHAGRTAPMGEIALASEDRAINVRSGGGLLLRLNAESPH